MIITTSSRYIPGGHMILEMPGVCHYKLLTLNLRENEAKIINSSIPFRLDIKVKIEIELIEKILCTI